MGGSLDRWYTLYIKTKRENDAAALLEKAGINAFNPLCRIRKVIRGRKIDVIEPLFPCYIFACFDYDENYRMIKYTRSVKKIVGNDGKPWAVSDEIINLIRGRMDEGVVKIQPKPFVSGEEVLIKRGPFEGVTGIFEKELKGKDRVLIFLKTLEYQARIEVDRFLLEKAV